MDMRPLQEKKVWVKSKCRVILNSFNKSNTTIEENNNCWNPNWLFIWNIVVRNLYEKEAATGSVLQKRCSWKCHKIHRKTPVPEPKACNFIKRETLAQVFTCIFCEISKNIILYRKRLVAASAPNRYLLVQN